ncbi:MAG TPA: DNA recombination protein RmuC [Holophagaceae bacterium]|nr:DNA recombination protein RmuC [Holophagaceae bacterium]
MTLQLLVTLLALLAACIAAWAALRPKGDDGLRDEIARARRDTQADLSAQLGPLHKQVQDLAQDLAASKAEQLRAQSEALAARFQALNDSIQEALRAGRLDQGDRLDKLQAQVQQRLEAIQKDSAEKLEKMRQTVDEKLHETLEKRLGESFNLVAQRLELVQKGLGEMQNLANDVGGLKRALTNVKTRGVLGEAQLGALLEQFLAPGQYAANVRIRPRANEVVEYAVKLPGPDEGGTVWLPIDAKFPIEDYQRLMEAYEVGDLATVETAAKALEARILTQAREIRDKYIAPPHSTDFALLFLPFEGLYAEALRRPGLLEKVQRECKVTFVGPTTLTAFLNSLQVGFKTLAISKQSSEVWKVLGQVKTEFGKFGDSLAAVQKKLDEASTKLGEVSKGKERMEKRLAGVEALPETEGPAALHLPYREE